MLLFIKGKIWTCSDYALFQYISCYSLSRNPPSFFLDGISFQYISCYSLSTGILSGRSYLRTFQYISCYSLSNGQARLANIIQQFQYISCYSLSEIEELHIKRKGEVSIHLMLLFIPLCSAVNPLLSIVSIHLMLLFIRIVCELMSNSILFQYISCYSLSTDSYWSVILHRSFNTSHVTLYPGCNCSEYPVIPGFNTSHVTLYRHKQLH